MPKYTSLTMVPDVVNKNGHLYPREALEKAVEKFQERIKKGEQVLGQYLDTESLGEWSADDISRIDLSRLCCETTNLTLDDDGVKAEVKLRGTCGNKIRDNLKKGIGYVVAPYLHVTTNKVDDAIVMTNISIQRMDIYPNIDYGWDVESMKEIPK